MSFYKIFHSIFMSSWLGDKSLISVSIMLWFGSV